MRKTLGLLVRIFSEYLCEITLGSSQCYRVCTGVLSAVQVSVCVIALPISCSPRLKLQLTSNNIPLFRVVWAQRWVSSRYLFIFYRLPTSEYFHSILSIELKVARASLNWLLPSKFSSNSCSPHFYQSRMYSLYNVLISSSQVRLSCEPDPCGLIYGTISRAFAPLLFCSSAINLWRYFVPLLLIGS